MSGAPQTGLPYTFQPQPSAAAAARAAGLRASQGSYMAAGMSAPGPVAFDLTQQQQQQSSAAGPRGFPANSWSPFMPQLTQPHTQVQGQPHQVTLHPGPHEFRRI